MATIVAVVPSSIAGCCVVLLPHVHYLACHLHYVMHLVVRTIMMVSMRRTRRSPPPPHRPLPHECGHSISREDQGVLLVEPGGSTLSLTTPTAPTAASPAPWLLAVVAVIIVAKSHDSSSAGRKIPLWQRHGISHQHHNCRHLCYRHGCLSFTGWLSRQQLHLHLHPALDFLLLPAGHPPTERGAGFTIADAPSHQLLPLSTATVFFFPLIV